MAAGRLSEGPLPVPHFVRTGWGSARCTRSQPCAGGRQRLRPGVITQHAPKQQQQRGGEEEEGVGGSAGDVAPRWAEAAPAALLTWRPLELRLLNCKQKKGKAGYCRGPGAERLQSPQGSQGREGGAFCHDSGAHASRHRAALPASLRAAHPPPAAEGEGEGEGRPPSLQQGGVVGVEHCLVPPPPCPAWQGLCRLQPEKGLWLPSCRPALGHRGVEALAVLRAPSSAASGG